MTNEKPDYDEVSDALFETLAALADLRERLVGGAQRSNVSPEQVVSEVWEAYDLQEADRVFSETDHERTHTSDPNDFAVDKLVTKDTDKE